MTSRSNPGCCHTTANIRTSTSACSDIVKIGQENRIPIENTPPFRQMPLHLGIVQLSPYHSRVQLHVSGATHIPPLLQVCWQTAKEISDQSNLFFSRIISNVRVSHKLPLYPGTHVHTFGAGIEFFSMRERQVGEDRYLYMSLGSDIEECKQLKARNMDLPKKRWKYSRVPQRESVYCAVQVLNMNIDFF